MSKEHQADYFFREKMFLLHYKKFAFSEMQVILLYGYVEWL